MKLNEVGLLDGFSDFNNWCFSKYQNARCYFKVTKENGGFKFIALQWLGNDINKPEWGDETDVEVILHGYACFDGVRHLHFGDEASDNIGYINYPNLETLSLIINKIKETEKEICSDFQ